MNFMENNNYPGGNNYGDNDYSGNNYGSNNYGDANYGGNDYNDNYMSEEEIRKKFPKEMVEEQNIKDRKSFSNAGMLILMSIIVVALMSVSIISLLFKKTTQSIDRPEVKLILDFYKAVEKGDTDAYLDCYLPEDIRKAYDKEYLIIYGKTFTEKIEWKVDVEKNNFKGTNIDKIRITDYSEEPYGEWEASYLSDELSNISGTNITVDEVKDISCKVVTDQKDKSKVYGYMNYTIYKLDGKWYILFSGDDEEDSSY